ncbi:hypothetical protein M427DRAFT_71327 [Gonapodya prolifera JEL478]|uniref:PH domain-containing protein n=1 Tax=Gonapodya prolifera (strain JEL478) TaxID=1344416 RepID=A0A139A9P2_GONPJ|nr:hypothetical protein M427DRAFT_71327 [Gonapodya prolifera JEL478]|eukprot:KXS13551.1 hypothetical protein M427DRAFT_71327 [Gonapodya prolifera JEL478]
MSSCFGCFEGDAEARSPLTTKEQERSRTIYSQSGGHLNTQNRLSWVRRSGDGGEKVNGRDAQLISRQPNRISNMSFLWRESAAEMGDLCRPKSYASQFTKREDEGEGAEDGVSQSLTSDRFGTVQSVATESTISLDGIPSERNGDESPSRSSAVIHTTAEAPAEDGSTANSPSTIGTKYLQSSSRTRDPVIIPSRTPSVSPNSRTGNDLFRHRSFGDFGPSSPVPVSTYISRVLGDTDRQLPRTIREKGRIPRNHSRERRPFSAVFRPGSRLSSVSMSNSPEFPSELSRNIFPDSTHPTPTSVPRISGEESNRALRTSSDNDFTWSHKKNTNTIPVDFLKTWSDAGTPVMTSSSSKLRRTRSVQSRNSESGSLGRSLHGRHRTESNNDADSVSLKTFSNSSSINNLKALSQSSSINNLRVIARSLTGGSNDPNETEHTSNLMFPDSIRRSTSQDSFRKSWLSFSSKETTGTIIIERAPMATPALPVPLWKEGLTKEQRAGLLLSQKEEERQEVIHEIVRTEGDYLTDLRLLCHNLLKNTPSSHPDYHATVRLAECLRELVTFVNNNVKWLENQEQLKTLDRLMSTDSLSLATPTNHILRRGNLTVHGPLSNLPPLPTTSSLLSVSALSSQNKGRRAKKSPDATCFVPDQMLHCVLLTDALLFTEPLTGRVRGSVSGVPSSHGKGYINVLHKLSILEKGVVHVTNVEKVEPPTGPLGLGFEDSQSRFLFRVSFCHTNSQSVVLAAKSSSEMEGWIASLKSAVQLHCTESKESLYDTLQDSALKHGWSLYVESASQVLHRNSTSSISDAVRGSSRYGSRSHSWDPSSVHDSFTVLDGGRRSWSIASADREPEPRASGSFPRNMVRPSVDGSIDESSKPPRIARPLELLENQSPLSPASPASVETPSPYNRASWFEMEAASSSAGSAGPPEISTSV